MNKSRFLLLSASHVRLLAVALGGAMAVAACAQQAVNDFEDSTTNTSSAGGGSGTTTNDGGNGGEGGEPIVYPCGIDCSTIAAPDCKQAVCDQVQGQCVVEDQEDGSFCDDMLFCTVNDSCQAGTCVGGEQNDCGMSPATCQELTCDEVAKNCAQTVSSNGAACANSELCQVGSTCSNGLCIGQPNDCFFSPVPNECYIPVCNPSNGICEPVIGNEGGACTDINDLCTVNKVCNTGVCVQGAPKDCSPFTQGCFNGTCEVATGVCFADPIAPGNTCLEGTDSCNNGTCDMNGSCVSNPTNEGGICDDGLSCTSATTCTTGTCDGGMSTISIYFSEDFSSNSAGWTMGTEWGIGSATASSPRGCGNPDPAADNSSTADNGIAGVVIGGTASTSGTHPTYYITSPVIDTNATVGPLLLSYYRFLNSDYTPFMQNFVEVWDGMAWVVLWQTASSPGVQDTAWTPMNHDIAAYKNAAMQVRFGFLIGSTGVFTCSGWNLDDVLIASGTCL